MKYPDVWGEGMIFAFSGLDGETDWFNPFVASTMKQPATLCFRLDDSRILHFKNEKLKDVIPEVICSDLIVFKKPEISIIFVEKDGILGRYSPNFLPSISSQTGSIKKIDNVILCSSNSGITALVVEKDRKIFSFSYDRTSKDDAIQKAKKLIKEKQIKNEIKKKLGFFEKFNCIKFDNEVEEKTYLKAMSVMKVNCESAQGKIKSTWTTPDRWPHKDMWFWDSAFHTFGNRYISYDLAEKTIAAVLNCQREDGFISITMNPEKGRVYENLTQPPLFAWSALALFQMTKNTDFLEFVYKAVSRYMEWLYKNRDNDSDGLLEWVIDESKTSKCGESGMDNSSRFDSVKTGESIAAIDLNCFAINEIRCLSKISKILKMKKHSVLWDNMVEDKTFLVKKHLWNKYENFYYDKKQNGRFIKVKTPASFLPLFARIPTRKEVEKIVRELTNPATFWTELPVPSVAKDEHTFCKDMWRGATWLNYNFLIYKGLKNYEFEDESKNLLIKTKKAVEKWYIEKGSIFEFYDPDNQTPPAELPRKDWLGTRGWTRTIADYHWSAAIYVAIINELKKEKDCESVVF